MSSVESAKKCGPHWCWDNEKKHICAYIQHLPRIWVMSIWRKRHVCVKIKKNRDFSYVVFTISSFEATQRGRGERKRLKRVLSNDLQILGLTNRLDCATDNVCQCLAMSQLMRMNTRTHESILHICSLLDLSAFESGCFVNFVIFAVIMREKWRFVCFSFCTFYCWTIVLIEN